MAMLEHCFIYAMKGLDSGHIKIGHSWNPRARLRSIAVMVEPVELLASIPGPERLEYEMHRRFAAHRVEVRGNEWFRNEGAVAAWLDAMPAEHRATGVYRVRRRSPHFTPEQAEAMRHYWHTHSGPKYERESAEFQKLHRHPFAPGAYLEGCGACTVRSWDRPTPPLTLSAALPCPPRASLAAEVAA